MPQLKRIALATSLAAVGMVGVVAGLQVGVTTAQQPAGASTTTPSGTPPATAAATPSAATKAPAPGAPPAPSSAPPPPAVTISLPVQRKVIEWDEYTGRFDAVASVDIRARVSGYLNEVHFQDGQIVKKGDILYSIDPRPFEAALGQAKAELAQATTKAQNSELDVERGLRTETRQ